jgi:soluble lytic murein transglycosylase-like protein
MEIRKLLGWTSLVLLMGSTGVVNAGPTHKSPKGSSKGAIVTASETTKALAGKVTKALTAKVSKAVSGKAKSDAEPAKFLVYSPEHRAPYANLISLAAYAYDVDASLVHAVISAESGYNPEARSRVGAVGLMQLMPATAARYGVTDINDPEQNIAAGTRYLKDLMAMFNNQMHLVIAAYNAGEGAVMKYGRKIPPYSETTKYVPKVLNFYKVYTNFIPAKQEPALRTAAVMAKS